MTVGRAGNGIALRWILVASVVAGSASACRSRAPAPRARAPVPSFHAEIEPVFVRLCASAEGCHGEAPSHSVVLDLRKGKAHHALVSAPAKTRRGAFRIVPGDPAGSFLLDKLAGKLAFGEGKPMPLDPNTGAPPEISPVPATFVERLLVPWITRGAPDD